MKAITLIIYVTVAVLISCIDKIENASYFTLLLNSLESFQYNDNSCFEIVSNNFYQNIELDITANGISKLIITNQKINISKAFTNNTLIFPFCPTDSQICLEYVNTDTISYFSNYCSLHVYIYGCKDASHPSTKNIVSVKSHVNKGVGCIPIEKTVWTDCAGLNNNCINPNTCSIKCEKLTCNSNDKSYSICTPIQSTEKRKATCSEFFSDSQVSVQQCTPSKDNKTDIEESSNDYSSNRFIKLLAIMIGVIIFGIIMSSFYYRIKLKEHGVPPFEPPFYMPGFIYPRPEKQGKFINN